MRCAPIHASWLVSRLAAALFAAALALPLAAPARADILISIDKTSQSMSVTVDGAPRYIWPVSTGRPGYDTPSGSYKVNRPGSRPLLAGMGQCADAAYDVLRPARPRHPRLFRR